MSYIPGSVIEYCVCLANVIQYAAKHHERWGITVLSAELAEQVTKIKQLTENGMDMKTRMSVVHFSFSYQYKVTNIHQVAENRGYEKQLYTLLQLVLREMIATCTLDKQLEKRDALSLLIVESIADKTAQLTGILTQRGK